MKYNDFVKITIESMDAPSFEVLKKALIGEYLKFSVIHDEEVSKEELAEKMCDYFEKMELKTGKNFDKQVDAFIKGIDYIVGKRVAKTPKPKKNDTTPIIVPRARKYYEKAISIKNSKNLSSRNLIDYSRLMFCLYTEIVKNKYKEISELDYSANCLKPDSIIEWMKNEYDIQVKNLKKNHFDIKELYSIDTCTFIISIIILHTIMSEKVQGDYYHE